MKNKIFQTSIWAVAMLLCFAGIGCLAQNNEKGEGGVMRVYPKESGRYLINPGKGWIVYRWFEHVSEAVWEKASVGYARFHWRDIHTGDNSFDWAPIDRMIQECQKRGKRFAFGIMPVCVNSKEDWVGMPGWVIEAGAKCYPSSAAPECKVPVWDDPVFIEKMGQLVSAMKERYNGRPEIEYIDCRTFGNWGEWHLGMLDGKDPGEAVKRQYLDQWAGFDRTWIIVPISGGSGMGAKGWGGEYGIYARDKRGFGAREDSSEHPPRWEICLPFLNYAPTVAEWSFPYAKIKHGQGWTGEKWRDEMLSGQVRGSCYSYQPLGEWNSSGSGDADIFLAEKGHLVDEWQNKMGYWFKMTEASYPGDLANGSSGRISFAIRNDGVAPIYMKGNTAVVKAALMDEDCRVLSATVLKGVNPFDWKPGQTVTNTAELSFPRSSKAAKIAIGVFSRESVENPDIRLGIENGTEKNWYLLSDMPDKPGPEKNQ